MRAIPTFRKPGPPSRCGNGLLDEGGITVKINYSDRTAEIS
jgi:hypothetical protein